MPVHLRLTAFVADELEVRSVLDIGGGFSSYLYLLKNVCNTAVADISAESLQIVAARKKMVGMLPDLGIKEKYEFVSALEVLEHLNPDNYEDSLREIDRVSSEAFQKKTIESGGGGMICGWFRRGLELYMIKTFHAKKDK